MKKIMNLILATTTCVVMMGSANAALNDTSKRTIEAQKHTNTQHQNKTSNDQKVKP